MDWCHRLHLEKLHHRPPNSDFLHKVEGPTEMESKSQLNFYSSYIYKKKKKQVRWIVTVFYLTHLQNISILICNRYKNNEHILYFCVYAKPLNSGVSYILKSPSRLDPLWALKDMMLPMAGLGSSSLALEPSLLSHWLLPRPKSSWEFFCCSTERPSVIFKVPKLPHSSWLLNSVLGNLLEWHIKF